MCVGFVSVDDMKLSSRLERQLYGQTDRHPPRAWADEPVLADYSSLRAVVADVRVLGDRSDALLRALLARPAADEAATLMITVALLPLVLGRCRSRLETVDDLLVEVALAVGDWRSGQMDVARQRVASRLVDRAWGQVRHRATLDRRATTSTLAGNSFECACVADGPEEIAIRRLSAVEIRARCNSEVWRREVVINAWNAAVQLHDKSPRTRTEQHRLRYARNLLNDRYGNTLVA